MFFNLRTNIFSEFLVFTSFFGFIFQKLALKSNILSFWGQATPSRLLPVDICHIFTTYLSAIRCEQTLKRIQPGAKNTDFQSHVSSASCQLPCHAYNVLYDASYPTASHIKFDGKIVWKRQKVATNFPQKIERQHRAFKNETVRQKFAGGKTLYTHVAFKFTVELFRSAVSTVKLDDTFRLIA